MQGSCMWHIQLTEPIKLTFAYYDTSSIKLYGKYFCFQIIIIIIFFEHVKYNSLLFQIQR